MHVPSARAKWSNLSQMKSALCRYAQEHGGQLPLRIEDLVPRHLESSNAIVCCPYRRVAGVWLSPADTPYELCVSGKSWNELSETNVIVRECSTVSPRYEVCKGGGPRRAD